jgi:predicted O-methyltransferase YrrM
MIDPRAVADQIYDLRGELDHVWNRGDAGTPIFHNAPGTHVASVEIEMGQYLRDLVIDSRPSVLVEVGTNKGFSSTWLILGMLENAKGHLTTFDIDDVRALYGKPYWDQFGLPKEMVTYVQKPVWGDPPELPAKIDFVFHDASHDVEPTSKEVEALAPRITAGGLMTFHDVRLCAHMGDFLIEWFKKHPDFDYSEWRCGRGLGIARRK